MNLMRSMKWRFILLIFCGLAAGVLFIARWNFVLAAGLMVGMNTMVMVQLKRYQGRLESLAFIDPVTGGRNLNRFLMDAEQTIRENPDGYMLASMDVQDFKMINNVYGREEGDRTLAYIYRKLQELLRNGELVARGNADVFYLLLKRQKEEDVVWRLRGMRNEINSFNDSRQDPYYLD